MLYPSIDALLEKVDSKYTLVTLASRRARDMQFVNKKTIDNPQSDKFVGKSLEEVHAGTLTYRSLNEDAE